MAARGAREGLWLEQACVSTWLGEPNQVLTHAARAAAKQLNKAPLVGARRARRALVRALVKVWVIS